MAKNQYDLSGEYGVLYLNAGKQVKFDKEDYKIISKYHWQVNNDGKGNLRVRTKVDGKYKEMSVLLGYTSKTCAKNLNALDLRKDNLEQRTHTQIGYTRKLSKCNKSGVKGVFYNEKTGKYIASIGYRRTTYYLGTYSTLKEATRARTIAGDSVFCHGYVNEEQKALAKVFAD